MTVTTWLRRNRSGLASALKSFFWFSSVLTKWSQGLFGLVERRRSWLARLMVMTKVMIMKIIINIISGYSNSKNSSPIIQCHLLVAIWVARKKRSSFETGEFSRVWRRGEATAWIWLWFAVTFAIFLHEWAGFWYLNDNSLIWTSIDKHRLLAGWFGLSHSVNVHFGKTYKREITYYTTKKHEHDTRTVPTGCLARFYTWVSLVASDIFSLIFVASG